VASRNVLVDIWLIAGLTAQLVDRVVASSRLTSSEFALYALIVEFSPTTAADLARATGLSPTTVSGILRRCERRGELTRLPNPDDRRAALLQLTPTGNDVFGSLLPAMGDLLGRVESAVGSGLPDLRLALQDLDTALRAVRGAGPRPYRLAPAEAEPPPSGRALVPRPTTEPRRGRAAEPPGSSIPYLGPHLDADQVAEVRRYIDWLRHRDSLEGWVHR
jgi:DNA-binding MarR family transcriptional regulator